MAEPILKQVQMLDQQVGPARSVTKGLADLFQSLRVDLAAFGKRSTAPTSTAAAAFKRTVAALRGICTSGS